MSLRTVRIAWYASNGTVDPTPEIQRAVQNCARRMSEAGAKVEQALPPMLKQIDEIRAKLGAADGRAHVSRLVRKHGTKQTAPTLGLGGEQIPSAQFTELIEKLDDARSRMLQFLESFDVLKPSQLTKKQDYSRHRKQGRRGPRPRTRGSAPLLFVHFLRKNDWH